jgi:hypothetical protein
MGLIIVQSYLSAISASWVAKGIDQRRKKGVWKRSAICKQELEHHLQGYPHHAADATKKAVFIQNALMSAVAESTPDMDAEMAVPPDRQTEHIHKLIEERRLAKASVDPSSEQKGRLRVSIGKSISKATRQKRSDLQKCGTGEDSYRILGSQAAYRSPWNSQQAESCLDA